jgi:cytoskeletal protein CcmA (bactofilin family)
MKKLSFKGLRAGRDISAFIGADVRIEGLLTFEGVVRLDGRFSGEIRSSGTLIIGEAAHIEAELQVDSVIVCGEVHGNIRARNRVELHAPAKLYGNILSPVLVIDEGVVFEGSCEMAEAALERGADRTITLVGRQGESRAEQDIF